MFLYKVWADPKPWVREKPRVIYISSSRDDALDYMGWLTEEDNPWYEYWIEAERRSYYGVTL